MFVIVDIVIYLLEAYYAEQISANSKVVVKVIVRVLLHIIHPVLLHVDPLVPLVLAGSSSSSLAVLLLAEVQEGGTLQSRVRLEQHRVIQALQVRGQRLHL